MAEPRWMQSVDRAVGALAERSHRRPLRTLAAVALVTALGFWASTRLSINADLTELLPRSFESVKDLDKLRHRFGGIGYVVVVARGGTAEGLRRFADDVAPQLAKLPGIRFVEHRRASEFFQDRALYYMELSDLQEVERRLLARERFERRRRNPMLITLDEEPAPSVDFSDLEARYRSASHERLAGNGEPYYLDAQARMVVLLAKPDNVSSDLDYSKQLIERVERFLGGLDLGRYGEGVTTATTGTFKKKIDQQEQITRDVAWATSLATLLMLLYLVLHFRSPLAVGFVLLPVFAGVTWTYGIVGVVYGEVNLLTAFAGAILGGLGTEHGIHLTGRYAALRGEGRSSADAVREAFSHTGGSALVSAVVGALAFLALGISEFRAFHEFGLIAGLGMVVIAGACLVTLPALMGVAARLGWTPRSTEAVTGRRSSIAALLPRHARPIAVTVGLGVLALVAMVPQSRFDYRLGSLEDSTIPSYVLDHEVNRILGYSQTPVVLLTERPGEERFLVQQVLQRKRELGERSTVDFVAALDDLVPEHQAEKEALLQSVERVLRHVKASELPPAQAARLRDFQRMATARPFTREDVPASVRRQFEGAQREEGGFVLIFPTVGIDEGDGIHAIAREVRGLRRPDGSTVSASGELLILSDILAMVQRESYPVLFAALFAVLATMWLTLGSLWRALACMAPTVVSVLALVGLLPSTALSFNFLNVIAVPVLIGTTVDAGVHLISRLTEAGDAFEVVFAETGRSIIGGLITSAVGFGAMIWADHPGLRSLGELTILGFSLNLLVMLLGFPAFFLWRRPAGPRPAAAPSTPAASPETDRA